MIEYTRSNRGFKQYPTIETSYGARIGVRESSTAFDPHIWMDVVEPEDLNKFASTGEFGIAKRATAHISIEQAETLIATLQAAIDNHFDREEIS